MVWVISKVSDLDINIGGNMIVLNNPSLTSFSGLDNIEWVGYSISIIYNDSLTDFSGLGKLDSIGSFLVSTGCTFKILDNLGRLVFSGNLLDGNPVDLPYHLISGVYHLIIYDQGASSHLRLIKQVYK